MTGWYDARLATALPVRQTRDAFPQQTSRRAAITVFSSLSAASNTILGPDHISER
jgi:hypothetical protein